MRQGRGRPRRTLLDGHHLTELEDRKVEGDPLNCDGDTLTLRLKAELRCCPGELWLVVPSNRGSDLKTRRYTPLIKALTRAYPSRRSLRRDCSAPQQLA